MKITNQAGNKWSHNHIPYASVPTEIIGECVNSRSCKSFLTSLGNGLCQTCWDRKSGTRINGV